MLEIYTADDLAEAHILKGLLESHNIQCRVKGEDLSFLRARLSAAPTVWIMDSKLFDKAKEIIKEYESSKVEDTSSNKAWHCKSCNEVSEVQFTECWSCGASRD